jgi:hypothetical protein
MNGVAIVHRITCTAVEPRHGRGGTARQGSTRLSGGDSSRGVRPCSACGGLCRDSVSKCQPHLSNLINRPDPRAVRYLGFPICCLSFSDVSQDPLPAGLPPERSEGHSILTEPGHPSPVLVNVPFVSVEISKVGKAGHQVFEGRNNRGDPESLWCSCLVCAKT